MQGESTTFVVFRPIARFFSSHPPTVRRRWHGFGTKMFRTDVFLASPWCSYRDDFALCPVLTISSFSLTASKSGGLLIKRCPPPRSSST
ncbi:hypothetical protein HPP92_023119 [Vanilla planifolia]|uniref:Uncharacterized protein n=1 Tax=Vanilla planifolia TaxID=51239 RepID=A0A835PWZ6_VANPL|nr:hypothetical protein HPP92_023119 [Vanilla planifolia]